MKRKIVLPLALALVIAVGSACFGQFAAVRMLYNFNGSITSNKFVHTLLLWAFIILPAYELAALADFLVLNVIEFWTGSNLLADQVAASDHRLARARIQQDGDGAIVITRGDKTYRVEALDEDRVVVTEGARLLGVTERQADGSLALYDEQGELVRVVSAAQVSEVEQNMHRLPAVQ